MKISILVWDLSMHSIVRTYPIAKVLERRYDVEIVGPFFEEGVYEPYKTEFNYKPAGPLRPSLTSFVPRIPRLVESIEGDVVYAFKPMPTSYGVGLLAKLFKRRPLVLDIEDLDSAFFSGRGLAERAYCAIREANSVDAETYIRLFEQLTWFADQKTVVSSLLQKRFGGVRLPHGADCSAFDPARFDRRRLRDEWGVQDDKVILFAGTVLPHKGMEDLVGALETLKQKQVKLLIAGKKSDYLEKLMKDRPYIKYAGLLPHHKMSEILSISDMVVIPQRDDPFAQAQIPGKVFEAMAMAKPIVATRVSDLPEILDGCGWTAEPGNAKQLAEAIGHVLDNPRESDEAGRRAREKCIRQYSWDAMEEILVKVFGKYG